MPTQKNEVEGKKFFMPVFYASRSLKGAKRQDGDELRSTCCCLEIEDILVVVMGTRFKVVTDHNALKALVNKASLEGRLAQWEDFIMGYDFEIIYR